MSRTRITWQNVAAPDFSDALTGVRQAGSAFREGFDGLANIAGDIRQGQMERATNDAITKALGITDPNQLAQAIASGQLGNPTDLTAEGMEFLQGQRSQLLTDQSTIASTEGTRAETAATNFALERSRIEDPVRWADARTDRARTEENREQEELNAALRTKALGVAEAAINGNGEIGHALTKDDAKARVRSQNLPADLEQIAFDQIDNTDDIQFTVNDLVTQAVVQNPDTKFGTVIENIESRRAEAGIAFGAQDDLRLYADSIREYSGSDNPILDVLDKQFGGNEGSINPLSTEESAQLNETRNSIIGLYNDLERKYNLPPEVIAGVVEETMKSGGWLSGGKLEKDEARIRQRLDKMNDPTNRKLLESRRTEYNRESQQLENFQTQAEKLIQTAAMARRNNNEARARDAEAQVEELWKEFNAWSEANTLVPVNPYKPVGGNPRHRQPRQN